MSRIKNVKAREIIDSRGTPTLEVDVYLESGDFAIPIQCRNQDVTIDVQNNSYLPCNFLSAEWTGIFAILSARMIA